jgi:predicted phosphodiesterase
MRRVCWIGAVAGSILLLFLAYLGFVNWSFRHDGRFPTVDWKAVKSVSRVGVLGDSQKGLANFRNIVRELRKADVDILLHTGDLVANNDEGHYLLARMYLRKGEATMPLVAPGNHDLKGGTERFQKWCGPLEQSLTIDGVAFVLLNNAFGNPIPSIDHIEERIAAAGPHRNLILAMHQPPFDLDQKPKPEYAGFLAWLEKSKVDYLMCGHVHGYFRKQVGGTTVIVNGVGGDFDAWQFDQKVYGTILEIKDGKVTDRRIELEPVHEIWENIHHLAIGHVAETYERHPILCWGGTLLLAAGVAWAIRTIFAKREPFKASPG